MPVDYEDYVTRFDGHRLVARFPNELMYTDRMDCFVKYCVGRISTGSPGNGVAVTVTNVAHRDFVEDMMSLTVVRRPGLAGARQRGV